MTTHARLKGRGRRLLLLLLVLALLAGGIAAWFFRPLPLEEAPQLEGLSASAERGAYLARIGNCAACHTAPGGQPFAGGLRFITDFGTIYSTNVTPDPEHGIGNWTFSQFHRAMKHGVGADGQYLYPAFPYTSFARMSDEDIASLYLHLERLAPVAEPERENEMSFPFGNRELLHFWQRMFHDSAAFTPDLERSDGWNTGAYLVEAVAHCGECHTPRNIIGGPDRSSHMQGGTYVDRTRHGTYRRWSAVDLTPGPRGLPHWSVEDFEAYLGEGQNRHTVVHGPMVEVFESTRQLTASDRSAIATYLSELEPGSGRFGWSLPSLGRDEGEIVYTVHCGTCHLPGGGGDPTLGVSLHNNPVVQAQDPSSLINVILYGPDLPPPPFSVGRSRMKPFGRRLSDADIAAVATYLRSNFGNNAGAVSADEVARQR